MLVGLLIGLTGIGSGSLLTPLLILLGNMSPATAVGTSISFSFLTKLYGSWKFYRRGLVNMEIVRDLSMGCLPGVLVGAFIIRYLNVRHPDVMNAFLRHSIGVALIVVAIMMVARMLPESKRPAVLDRPLLLSIGLRRLFIIVVGFRRGREHDSDFDWKWRRVDPGHDSFLSPRFRHLGGDEPLRRYDTSGDRGHSALRVRPHRLEGGGRPGMRLDTSVVGFKPRPRRTPPPRHRWNYRRRADGHGSLYNRFLKLMPPTTRPANPPDQAITQNQRKYILAAAVGLCAVVWFFVLSGWMDVKPGSVMVARNNVLFNSDTNLWVNRIIDNARSPQQLVHPLELYLWRGPCRALYHLLEIGVPPEKARLLATRFFAALFAGIGVAFFAFLALRNGIRGTQFVLLFILYLLFTSSATICLPEHFAISCGLLTIAFVIPFVVANSKTRTAIFGGAGCSLRRNNGNECRFSSGVTGAFFHQVDARENNCGSDGASGGGGDVSICLFQERQHSLVYPPTT